MKRFISTGRQVSLAAVITVITLLTALTACRTSRQASDTIAKPDMASMPLDQRIRYVAEGNRPWTQLSLPIRIELKSPQAMAINGRIYMRRDHDIYITVRALGIEVANMYVNSDSIFVSEKMHKYYFAEPISNLFSGAALTVGDIQDILLGRVFINGKGTLTENLIDDVTVARDKDNQWTTTPIAKIGGKTECRFTFSDTDNQINTLMFLTGNKIYGCGYSQPATIDGDSRFMSRLTAATIVGSTMVAATISFDFKKLKQEVPASARWRQPKGYERITHASLLKALVGK